MKTQRISNGKRGFTLMELMVAMAVTTIIVTVLVSVTSIALDTWNRSRAELRASRQAKSMLDIMSRDFESLIARKGDKSEWLSAVTSARSVGDGDLKSTNASELIFFTAVTDRYNGDLGPDAPGDNGGDVSCVTYKLSYKDPVVDSATSDFETFVLNRLVVDPDVTFEKLLGKEDLEAEFSTFESELDAPENFVCENVFQFSVTFHVQVGLKDDTSGEITQVNVPITVGQENSGQTTKKFKISGTGLETEINGGTVSQSELAGGRVNAVEISVTVLSDFAIEQLKRRSFKNDDQKSDFMAQNSYQFSKLVQIPSM